MADETSKSLEPPAKKTKKEKEKKEGHPPRPCNSWILYRQYRSQDFAKREIKLANGDICRLTHGLVPALCLSFFIPFFKKESRLIKRMYSTHHCPGVARQPSSWQGVLGADGAGES